MSETPVPETPEEDLLPEPEPKKEPFVSIWDVVTLAALLLVGGGFWFWYSSARTESTSHFHHADSLYLAGDYPAAMEAYEALRASEAVVAGKDDSLMYRRMDSLVSFQEADLRLSEAARAALVSEDTTLIRAAREGLAQRGHGFVPQSLLDSLAR